MAVRFHLHPRAPGRYSVTGFRGPPPNPFQPGFPLRGIFYYDWFPEGWSQEGIFPFSKYHPSLGWYDSGDPAVIRRHVDAMVYAHLPVGLFDWWGIGTPQDARFPAALAVARRTPLHWALVAEQEGYGNPSVEQIRADLEHIRARYASSPAYLKLDGRFVVLPYGDPSDDCRTVDRWLAANERIGAYLILRVFPRFETCPRQPDGWYQFFADRYEYSAGPAFYGVLAGYEKIGIQYAPPLPRIPVPAWRQAISDMLASGARNQFVISFNEWGEGSAIESASEWASPSGYGLYLDALHELLPPLVSP